MTLEEAFSKFNQYQQEAEQGLAAYGDDPIVRNAAVTAHYHAIAESDPLFVWFSAATLGSYQVGKVLQATQYPLAKDCEASQIIYSAFPYGNQLIHNNMSALYTLYKQNGLEAIEYLHANGDITDQGLSGFKIMHQLESQIKARTAEIVLNIDNWGAKTTDMQVINYLLQDVAFRSDLHKACIDFVYHEQSMVEDMYTMPTGVSLTLEEMLKDEGLFHQLQELMAEWQHLNGATLLDNKFFSATGYDFSEHSDRMEYFGTIFDQYFDDLEHNRLADYHDLRETLVDENSHHWTVPEKGTPLITKETFSTMEIHLIRDAATQKWVDPLPKASYGGDSIYNKSGSWCFKGKHVDNKECQHIFDGVALKERDNMFLRCRHYNDKPTHTQWNTYTYSDIQNGKLNKSPLFMKTLATSEYEIDFEVGDFNSLHVELFSGMAPMPSNDYAILGLEGVPLEWVV